MSNKVSNKFRELFHDYADIVFGSTASPISPNPLMPYCNYVLAFAIMLPSLQILYRGQQTTADNGTVFSDGQNTSSKYY